MWKYIEEINWANRSQQKRGYEDGKMYMLENFTKKRCEEIRDFVDKRMFELYNRVNAFEKENNVHCGDYGGDDSFGDMLHHVIGLGEAKFNEIMEDPSKLDGMNYVESFSYCMPDDEDYEMIKASYHLTRASAAVVALARIVTENNPSDDDLRTIKEMMNRFLTMLEGNFKEACQDFDRATYTRYYEFEANDCRAQFANYISDCKQFMVK